MSRPQIKVGLTFWALDEENPDNPMHLHVVWARGTRKVNDGSVEKVCAVSVVQSTPMRKKVTLPVDSRDHPRIKHPSHLNLYPHLILREQDIMREIEKKERQERLGHDYRFKVVEPASSYFLKKIFELGSRDDSIPPKVKKTYAEAGRFLSQAASVENTSQQWRSK